MQHYKGFYPSPMPRDRAGITIVSIGKSVMGSGPKRFRRDDGWHSHQLMFTIAGAGIGDVVGVPFAVEVGDVCLMPKDRSHGYEPASGHETWQYLWIEFDGGCAPDLLSMLGLDCRAQVSRCGLIAEPVDEIFSILGERGDAALHEAVALLMRILVLIERAAAKPIERQRHASVVESVKQHMAQHLDQPLSLAGLAVAVGMSPYHLNRMFRQRTGVPPMRYLRQMRANRAKALLHRHDLKFAEIGREVGYPVLQHFSRMFKQETGMTPRRFVREIVRGPA